MDTVGTTREDSFIAHWMPLPPVRPRLSYRFSELIKHTASVLNATQIVFVGLILLPLSPDYSRHPGALWRTIGVALVASILATTIYRASQLPCDGMIVNPRQSMVRALHVAGAVIIAFGMLAAFQVLISGYGNATATLAKWACISSPIAALLQFALVRQSRVAIVGKADSATSLAWKLVRMSGSDRVTIVASLDGDNPADIQHLDELVAKGEVDTVLVPDASDMSLLRTLCTRLADTAIRLRLALAADVMPLSPFVAGATGVRASVPLIDLLPLPMGGWRRVSKRAFDLGVALMLLPLLFPVLILIAVAIRLDSPGPVFFRQWRFGQGSKPVLIYKFRTMRIDTSDTTGSIQTLAFDPRVTRVGRVLRRLSLDEFPQLLNVLRGEMSLVGPRPHATHMKVQGAYYFEAVDYYRARHRVLPGITGWAQINGSRGGLDTLEKAERRVELDLWYVSNWSLMLDIWILFRTAFGGFATLRAD